MSVVYNGSHSVDFFKMAEGDEKGVCHNSWYDLYLVPVPRPYLDNNQPSYRYTNIPLENYRADTTELFLEGIIRGIKNGTFEFYIDHDKYESFEDYYKTLTRYFDGSKFAVRLADSTNAETMYEGRLMIDRYEPGTDYSKIAVRYMLYKKFIDFGSLYFIIKYYDWDGTPVSSERIPWGGSPSFPGGSGSWGGGGGSGGGGAGHSNGYYIKIGPAKIEIIEEPNRHIYVDGEIVDYTGIVIQVIDKKGEPWTNDGNFPNGILPINPSQLPRITAHRHDGIEQDVYVNWVKSGVKFSDSYTIRVYANEKAAIIKIVDPMIKKFYVEGDTIDYVGMSVAIYDKYKDEWAREAYPDGRVPQNELILQSKAHENPNSAYVDIPVQWISPDGDLLSTSAEIIVGNIVHDRQYLNSTFSTFDGTKVIKIESQQAFRNCINLKVADFPVCSYVGNWTFYNCPSLISISFPLCTYIGYDTFVGCSSLIDASLPLCSYIGEYAFRSCISLKTVDIPLCSIIGPWAFADCDSIESIELSLCSRLESYVLYSCSSLKTIDAPMCTYIGSMAFYNDSSLSSVNIPKCTYIGNDAFNKCGLSIAYFSLCSYIGQEGFYSCSILSIANFPNCISMSTDVFGNCRTLKEITFPKLTFVNHSTFLSCYNLQDVSLPECVSIGRSAFWHCRSLKEIKLSKCNYIDTYAFYYCTSLKQISFPNLIDTGTDVFLGCNGLNDVYLPKYSVVRNAAFQYCSSLKEITLPLCMKIENYAFAWCQTLEFIDLPECENIGSYAFEVCYSLSKLELIKCSYIGLSAFYACRRFTNLTLSNSGVCSLENANAFNNTPIAGYTQYTSGQLGSIYVPASLISEYQVAPGWSTYSYRFAPIPTDSVP